MASSSSWLQRGSTGRRGAPQPGSTWRPGHQRACPACRASGLGWEMRCEVKVAVSGGGEEGGAAQGGSLASNCCSGSFTPRWISPIGTCLPAPAPAPVRVDAQDVDPLGVPAPAPEMVLNEAAGGARREHMRGATFSKCRLGVRTSPSSYSTQQIPARPPGGGAASHACAPPSAAVFQLPPCRPHTAGWLPPARQ